MSLYGIVVVFYLDKTMEKEKIEKAISLFNSKKILVIGDVMVDKYTFGKVSGISPEAPIPILKAANETYVLGGAANVANNLSSLNATVFLCGIVGKDEAADVFLNLLKKNNISNSCIVIDKARPTTLKHRYIVGNQQLLRVDQEVDTNLEKEFEEKIIRNITKVIDEVDGVILSDYAKGIFSKSLSKQIITLAKRSGKQIIADIKPQNKEYFTGVDVLTPNLKEAKEMTGLTDIDKIGKKLVKLFQSNIIITKGENGLSVFTKQGKSHHISSKKIEVFDVSGAGDTVIAVEALGLVTGLSLEESATMANFAGSLVVQKQGTATITKGELESILYEEYHIESTNIVPKLWGYEKWIENNDKYCSKLLFLKKGYQCSLHYHKIKDEMFIVTKGNVRLEVGDKIIHMRTGNFYRIPPNTPHRFRGIEESFLIEVSTTHMEEDSYRIEESRKV